MTLAADVQNVTATGTASIRISGNSLDNTIIGNRGNNTVKAGAGDDAVDGGYGNDSLSGGAGDDKFIFSSKLGSDKIDRKVNFDKITDFTSKDDTIELDKQDLQEAWQGWGSEEQLLHRWHRGQGQERLPHLQQGDGCSVLRCRWLGIEGCGGVRSAQEGSCAEVQRPRHHLTEPEGLHPSSKRRAVRARLLH